MPLKCIVESFLELVLDPFGIVTILPLLMLKEISQLRVCLNFKIIAQVRAPKKNPVTYTHPITMQGIEGAVNVSNKKPTTGGIANPPMPVKKCSMPVMQLTFPMPNMSRADRARVLIYAELNNP